MRLIMLHSSDLPLTVDKDELLQFEIPEGQVLAVRRRNKVDNLPEEGCSLHLRQPLPPLEKVVEVSVCLLRDEKHFVLQLIDVAQWLDAITVCQEKIGFRHKVLEGDYLRSQTLVVERVCKLIVAWVTTILAFTDIDQVATKRDERCDGGKRGEGRR